MEIPRALRLIILAILGILAVLILYGAVSFIVDIASGTDDRPVEDQVALVDYVGTDVKARYTIDGPIVGNEQHYAARITISDDERVIDIIQGYEGRIIETKKYPNNSDAYRVFLQAIDNFGFTLERPLKEDVDVTGTCPKRSRYIYQLVEDGEEISNLWSNDCSKKAGNFLGSPRTIRDLFTKQIPDYKDIVDEIDI